MLDTTTLSGSALALLRRHIDQGEIPVDDSSPLPSVSASPHR